MIRLSNAGGAILGVPGRSQYIRSSEEQVTYRVGQVPSERAKLRHQR